MTSPKHTVKILIDAHERDLIAMFGRVYPQGNPELDFSQNLTYGDIQFVVDGKLSMIIERKRADDFRASVTGKKDPSVTPEKTLTPAQQLYPKREVKRFRKQRDNLIIQRRENPGLVIMYIFEGSVYDLYYSPQAVVKPADLDKLQKELVRKYGIPTEYGKNISDTVRAIGHIRDICAEYGSAEQCCAKPTPEGVAAMGAKKQIQGVVGLQMSPGQFLGRALVNVHGMTPDKAEVIVRHYHTLPNLLRCYGRLRTEKERKRMLADYKVSEDKKYFGPKLSERVYLSIFTSTPEEEEETLANSNIATPEHVNKPPARPRTPARKKPPTHTFDALVQVAVSARRRNVLED